MWVRNPESYIQDLEAHQREQEKEGKRYIQRRLDYKKNNRSSSATMIPNTLECLDYEDETKIYRTMIKKFWKILFVLLIIFTIIFFMCFGCFLVLNDSTSLIAQTVTLSSEGGANETYPDSMGEYQLAEEMGGYSWYRHKDREDRFLMYNKQGKMQ